LNDLPIIDVKLDAGQLGASTSIQMYDDGNNGGDLNAGDGIYSGRATVNKGGTSVADARVRVIATDSDGDFSGKTDDTPIQIDNTKPVINIAGTLMGDINPANGYINKAEIPGTGVPNFVVNGSTDAEDGQTVTVKIFDDSGATLKWTKSTTASAGLWQVNLTATEVQGLKEGTNTIRFTADVKDRVGNAALQGVKTFSKDTTPPPLTINDPLAGDNWVSAAEIQSGFTVAGLVTPDGGSAIGLRVTDSVGYDLEYSLPNSTMSWSQTIGSSQGEGLADGVLTVAVEYTDKAGNSSTAQKTITKDTQAPSIAFRNPLAGDANGNGFIDGVSPDEVSGGFIIDGTTTGAQQGRPVAVTVSGSGGPYNKSGTVAADGSWWVQLTSIEASSLLGGDIVLAAQVSDTSGNGAQTQKTLYRPSAIAINDPIAGDNRLNEAETNLGITISGTIQSTLGSNIKLTVTDRHGYELIYNFAVTGGTWAQVLTANQLKVLDDGDLQVQVTNTNASGVVSTAGKTVVKDTLKPTVTIASPPTGDLDGNGYITQNEIDAGFVINGTSTAEQGRMVAVQVTDGSALFQLQGAVTVAGTWQVALTKAQGDQLNQGTITFRADVADLAQNAAQQVTRTLVKDTLAPTAGFAPVLAGDLNADQVINRAETNQGATQSMTVNGSTAGVPDGQTVTVTVTDNVIATPFQKTATCDRRPVVGAVYPPGTHSTGGRCQQHPVHRQGTGSGGQCRPGHQDPLQGRDAAGGRLRRSPGGRSKCRRYHQSGGQRRHLHRERHHRGGGECPAGDRAGERWCHHHRAHRQRQRQCLAVGPGTGRDQRPERWRPEHHLYRRRQGQGG
jgi:large repetitive protein